MSLKKNLLPIFLSTGTVFAFITSFVKPDFSYSETNISPSPNLDPTPTVQKKIDKTTQNPQQLQKLSVLPLRCIGCGRCVGIDSSHFEISPTTGKAIVISSTNLNSKNLAIAINNCPVQAITLQ